MTDWRNRIIETRLVSASELAKNASNFRRHPEPQAKAVRGLLKEVGIVAPLIAYESERAGGALTLIDGHLRQETGGEWPVTILNVSDAEADIILASLDYTASMAEMDATALAELLGRVDMHAIEDDGLSALLEELATASGAGADAGEPVDAEPQIDRAEELRQKWAVEPGDLWLLDSGKGHAHRLVCGDCTDAAVVRRVLGGDTPLLMVTDPPYGVNYDPEQRSTAKSTGKIEGDDIADWRAAYKLFFGEVAYVWHASMTSHAFRESLIASGLMPRSMIVWRKPYALLSFADYHWQHELCWYAVRDGCGGGFVGPKGETTVWEMTQAKDPYGRSGEDSTPHPTQKPLECMARPIRNHEGDVYEPFCGSGTTIIAAENLGRRCYAVEISPGYVAVALERFATATGCDPVRIENAPAEAEAVGA